MCKGTEYTCNTPFLDNKGTSGIGPKVPGVKITPTGHEKQVNRNRKRCLRQTRQVYQNRRNAQAISSYMQSEKGEMALKLAGKGCGKLTENLTRLIRNLESCGRHALFREHETTNDLEFIGAHTCDDKFCMVCNAVRAKTLRRKFLAFFKADPSLLRKYDFFHLTLTVPHDENGYKGQRWYTKELLKKFNFLRKKTWWKREVYAGEFGVEMTKNESGYHLHIHSLVLVRKSKRSRNRLHREILLSWNSLTKGAGQRAAFTEEQKAAIMRGNSLLTRSDVESLDPTGATLIGFENIYVRSDTFKPGYKHCPITNTWKRYVKPTDGAETFISGILECIKYHFEPMALQEDGKLNVPLLVEIINDVKGQRLFGKFGAFHSATKNAHPLAKMLNLNSKLEDFSDQVAETLDETARDVVLNPTTGKPADRREYSYVVTDIAKVYVDPDDGHRIKFREGAKVCRLGPWVDTVQALTEIEFMAVAWSLRRRRQPARRKAKFDEYSAEKLRTAIYNKLQNSI